MTHYSPTTDSLLPINEQFWRRFPNFVEVESKGETMVETQTLADFVAAHNVAHIDFLKLDVEGVELDILRAGKDVLRQKNILGIVTEYAWEPNIKLGLAGLAEMDEFLRREGFFLFDLETWRFPRATLPVGHIQSKLQQDGSAVLTEPERYASYGQLVGGNALYFRDPIKAMQDGTDSLIWDEGMILRFAALLDLFNYQDFAIEIVNYFSESLQAARPETLIDYLTPPLGNVAIPYDEYYRLSSTLYCNALRPDLRDRAMAYAKMRAPAASGGKKVSRA